MTNILVTGSREWDDARYVYSWLEKLLDYYDKINIIVGDCKRGVDNIVKNWCENKQISYIEFCADWDTHGKPAGMIRNTAMVQHLVKDGGVCLAFIKNESRGASGTVRIAKKHKIPCIVIKIDDDRDFFLQLS